MAFPRRADARIVVAAAAIAIACGSPTSTPGPSSTTSATANASASGPSPSASASGSAGVADLASVHLDLTEFASGFVQPLFLTHAGDGTGRTYVVEQRGTIELVEPAGQVEAEPFLDITERVSSGGEQGLLGLAFHPGFRLNGRVFVNYTDVNGDTVISEFHATATRADPKTERVILRIDQPFSNHNGGWIAFGPDRYLYIGMGDGGSGGDPMGNGQRRNTLLGKLLRIDVDRGDPYGIPPDNPFAKESGSRPEIWAYGLRNPWRNSFDRTTGDLFIGDVGQSRLEELDAQPPGKGGLNYGWNTMEGDACFRVDPCDRTGLTLPVLSYGRDEGTTITGGYVYRGKQYPFFDGAYVFGDFGSGAVWAIRAQDALSGHPQKVKLRDADILISSFGEDEAGELYLTDHGNGIVYRLVPSTG